MDGDSQKDSSADHLSEDGTQRNLDELPEQEIKKLKNRHSTQLSRKRRKLYEDLLEEKYNDLNNQYKNEIQKLNLNNSLSDKMKKYISFLRQKKVIESKMEESIARDALDKEVIGKILMDGVLYRLGPKGHTRESLCNLLVSMIIDEIFPEPYKFVFCLLNNEHMKDRVESAEIMKLNTLMHEDQLNLLRDHFGEEIMSIKSRYNSLIEKLTALKRNILDDQKDIENLLHHAANIVSSTKRSNYVNFIEFCILGNERLDAYFEEHEVSRAYRGRGSPEETQAARAREYDEVRMPRTRRRHR